MNEVNILISFTKFGEKNQPIFIFHKYSNKVKNI